MTKVAIPAVSMTLRKRMGYHRYSERKLEEYISLTAFRVLVGAFKQDGPATTSPYHLIVWLPSPRLSAMAKLAVGAH